MRIRIHKILSMRIWIQNNKILLIAFKTFFMSQENILPKP